MKKSNINIQNKCRLVYAAVILAYVGLVIGCLIHSLSLPYTGQPYYLQENE